MCATPAVPYVATAVTTRPPAASASPSTADDTAGPVIAGSGTYPFDWTVDRVCEWLTECGLSEYTTNFKTDNINGKSLLNDITESTISDLGITQGLHKSRILREISELKAKSKNTKDVKTPATLT